MQLTKLQAFRQGLFACFSRRADALFQVADALLTSPQAHSLVELSLALAFTGHWSTLYAALALGVIDRTALRTLFAQHVPRPPAGRPFLLGWDVCNIFRPYAHTSRDRRALHVPNLGPHDHATRPGWQMSSLVVLPDPPSAATYTLDNVRVPTDKTPTQVAAAQLTACVPLLPEVRDDEGRVLHPRLVCDRASGNARFVAATAAVRCGKLLRTPRNRAFYGAPPARTGKGGAPAKHGPRFKLDEPETWTTPDRTWNSPAEAEPRVEVAAWDTLHLKGAPAVPLSVIRVTYPAAPEDGRTERVSWYTWVGVDGELLGLEEVVPEYRRRYGQEHGFRWGKQDLLWASVRLRTPEQFQRWTDLVEAVRNQVVLALLAGVAERRPWEREERPVSVQQARRGLLRIMEELGTPARRGQPRGKGRGRARGALVKRAPRQPVVRKGRKGVPKKGRKPQPAVVAA
jgi:DDE superfamily endonuclease